MLVVLIHSNFSCNVLFDLFCQGFGFVKIRFFHSILLLIYLIFLFLSSFLLFRIVGLWLCSEAFLRLGEFCRYMLDVYFPNCLIKFCSFHLLALLCVILLLVKLNLFLFFYIVLRNIEFVFVLLLSLLIVLLIYFLILFSLNLIF